MIVPVMAISNLVLTRQIYSEETNGAHAHNRDRVLLKLSLWIKWSKVLIYVLFYTSSAKVRSTKQSTYLCVILHIKYTTLYQFSAVFNRFLIIAKTQGLHHP